MELQRRRIIENEQAWERVGLAEAALRARELPGLSTPRVLAYLAPAFELAAKTAELRPVSGLVVQQSWFARLRERDSVH